MKTNMKTLLNNLPTHTLGYPIGNTFKIILYFLIPSILLFVLYLNLILADFTLVILHFYEDNPRWATSTILLVCWPAIASFMFTVASPSLWPGDTPLAKENLKFLAVQLLHFTLFPLGVSYRYVYQIFWAIEATFASLRRDEIRREEALAVLMQPNTMELYLFFQAYLHCAPQILLQFYIMLRIYRPYSDTMRVQLLSIAACLLKMSVTTTSYQRFERRKVLGAQYPWSVYRKHLMKKFSEKPTQPKSSCKPELISNIYGIDLNRYSRATTVRASSLVVDEAESLKPAPSDPKTHISGTGEDGNGEDTKMIPKTLEEVDSDNEFYNDDVFHRIQSSPPPEYKVDDDIIQIESSSPTRKKLHVSIVENSDVEERRNKSPRRYNIVDMSMHVTPPETPAPRISLHALKDKIISNTETIREKIPHRTYKDNDEIGLPVRVKEKAIKGISQEDGIAKFISFMSWWLFITARILAIVTFSYFYFEASVYICVAHYLLMVLFLLCNSWKESVYRKFFYVFLGYVYLFCLIEFKMKFRKVRLWYGLYFIIVSGENFIMTAVWFWNGSWDVWWFGFMAVVMIFSTFLSYMAFLSYFLMLKPRPVTVYPIVSSQSLFPATL